MSKEKGILEALARNELLGSVEPSEFIEFTDFDGNWIKYRLYKQGRWLRDMGGYWCSVCNCFNDYHTKYCPNCGARMGGDNK